MTQAYCNAPEYLGHIYTLCNPDAYYDFDDVVVVQDTRDGKVYAAQDAGCSCTTPFENHVFPTDFVEISSGKMLETYLEQCYPKYDPLDIELAVAGVKKALGQ